MSFRHTCLIALVLTATSCSSSEPEDPEPVQPDPVRISGRYEGTGRVSSTAQIVHVFALGEDSNGLINGDVTMTVIGGSGEDFDFEVSGSHYDAEFDLDIGGTSSGLDFQGASNADASRMIGVMDWPDDTIPDYSLTVTNVALARHGVDIAQKTSRNDAEQIARMEEMLSALESSTRSQLRSADD